MPTKRTRPGKSIKMYGIDNEEWNMFHSFARMENLTIGDFMRKATMYYIKKEGLTVHGKWVDTIFSKMKK